MSLTKYMAVMNIILILLMVGLFVFGNFPLFILAYIVVFVVIAVRTMITQGLKRIKFILLIAFLATLSIQIVACAFIVFPNSDPPEAWHYVRKAFGVLLLLLPMLVSRYISVGKYASFYLPSLQDAVTISFAELNSGRDAVMRGVDMLHHAGKSWSIENLTSMAVDLPRFDSFRYTNNGTLTTEYFELVNSTMDDLGIYIIISNTGSPASEIISVFTKNQFNHASLSFDRDLKTTISYNGGERVYPPGLNAEMIEYFNQKSDSAILVYRLPCSAAQKRLIAEKVSEINREGSAYNILGLVHKHSFKPNIMFCSQFVYRMLQYADLAYFTKNDGRVAPTDLIEQDYKKKLEFIREIRLN
ncbi:MAG: hypothetical protein LBN36_09345 [Clostridiales Family XIII bacterium]|nr:hypothetical protein [Clostridiales Family XIII bacterium]